MESIKRFFQGSQQSFFLFGPRGTGKSTWVRRHMPEAFLIDLLVPDQLRFYSAKPERLRDVTEAQQSVRTIVIDEVQKAPALLDVVHYLMEKHRLRFVSGRADVTSAPESIFWPAVPSKRDAPVWRCRVSDRFSSRRACGSVCALVSARNPAEAISAYTGPTYEEVDGRSAVRDFPLRVREFLHGAVLNISDGHGIAGGQTGKLLPFEDLMLRACRFFHDAPRHLAAHRNLFLRSGFILSDRPGLSINHRKSKGRP
jgi:hypothetical protein